MKAIVTMLVANAALMLAGLSAAKATAITGECDGTTQTNFLMSDAGQNTDSGNWQNVTDGHVSFTMATPGCAIVTFSAPTFIAASASYTGVHVQVVLDGASLCAPASYVDYLLWAQDEENPIGSSTIRICDHLSAGAHTLQVQFRVDQGNNGEFGGIIGHTLTITHP